MAEEQFSALTDDELDAIKKKAALSNIIGGIGEAFANQRSAGEYFLGQPRAKTSIDEVDPAQLEKRAMLQKYLKEKPARDKAAFKAKVSSLINYAKDDATKQRLSSLLSQVDAGGSIPDISTDEQYMGEAYKSGLQAANKKAEQEADYKKAMDLARVNNAAEMAKALASEKAKGPKPLTEFEGKSLGFYDRAKESQDLLQKFNDESRFNSAGGILAPAWSTQSILPESAQSDDYKEYKQAKDNFIAASLRQESGAAIGDQEYNKQDKIFFPQKGDSQKVIDQKARAREAVINALKMGAGPNVEAYSSYKKQEPSFNGNKNTGQLIESANADYSKIQIPEHINNLSREEVLKRLRGQ